MTVIAHVDVMEMKSTTQLHLLTH